MTLVEVLKTRYRPLWIIGAFYLVLSVATRILFWAMFGSAQGVATLAMPGILAVGVVNDVVELVYLLLPFAILLTLLPQDWATRRVPRTLMWLASLLAIFSLLYLAVMEYFFFEEFDARFNRVAVDYLVSPHEVLGNIYESYPVVPDSIAIAVLCVLAMRVMWPRIRAGAETPAPLRRRGAVLGAHIALVVLAAVFFATDTLALFQNRVSNELAANGPSSFFNALRTNRLEYAAFYRTGDPAQMMQLLRDNLATSGGTFVRPDRLDRHFDARPDGLGKLNVVVLSEESFGAEFSGVYGDKRGLTPNFDELSKQGLLFTHSYASGTRTVRGLEAMSASLPPIPSDSVVKRPGNEHVVTWGEVMQRLGYQSSFLYGGYGYFDNMNAYFGANGFDVSDRTDIQNPSFANIWGVADEDLMRHAIDYYDARSKEGKPFFSIVMSTSNHKPFTFPPGIPGVPEKGGGREAGVRYADYAIGQFFQEARKHDWYKNTVFVVMADHGARVYGAAQIPLFSYEIPFLIIAPGVAPRAVDTLTGQVDLAPTVLGLLGLSYEAPFFGRDVLHYPDPHRVLLFNHNQKIAMLRDGELAILGLQRSAQSVAWHRDPALPARESDLYTPLPPNDSLIDLATAYYQIASDMFERKLYE